MTSAGWWGISAAATAAATAATASLSPSSHGVSERHVSSPVEQLLLVQDVQDACVHAVPLAVNTVSLPALGAKCRALLPAPSYSTYTPAYVTGLRRLSVTRLGLTRAVAEALAEGLLPVSSGPP